MTDINNNISAAYLSMLEEKKKPKKDEVLDDGDGMDPVGQGDADIDNDGDVDKSDEYLTKRRAAIKKDMKKEDLDEDLEMVKKEKDPKGGYIVTLKDKKGKLIKRHMKDGKVTDMKEEVEQLDELTAEEKKLIDKMYDKKGNLTPLGKKVFAAGQKNESVYGTQAQRLMSPLQKARQDKEKSDRDRDGKLKSTALPMKKKKNEEVNLDELTKKQKQALQNVKAQPKHKVSLKKAPWDKKEDVSEGEGETTPCPKCEGSTENHSPDCPTQKETKAKDNTAVVSPKAETKTEARKWTVYKRIMEKAAQTAGAVAGEEIDSKESKGSKEFAAAHDTPPSDVADVEKAIEKNLKTMSSDPIKHAPLRSGDNKAGDAKADKPEGKM